MAVPPNEVQCETLSVLHDLKTSFAQLYGDIESYRTHAQGIETRIADCRNVLRQLNVDPRACEASTSPVPSRSAAPGSAHAAGGSSPGPTSPAAAGGGGGTVLSPGTLLERDVKRTLAETERLLETADSLAHTSSEQQQQQQQQQEFEELALSTWERDVLSDPATPRDNAGEAAAAAAAAAPILLNVSSTSTAGGGVGVGVSSGGVPGVRTSCASSAATRPQESPTLAPALAPSGSSPAASPRSSKAGSPKAEKKEKKEKKASGKEKEKEKDKKEKREEKPTSPRAASPKAASSPKGGSKADKAAEKLDKQLDKEIEKLLADGVWKTKQDDRGHSYYYLAASKKTRVWNLKKHLMQEREAKAGTTSSKASSSHQAKAQ